MNSASAPKKTPVICYDTSNGAAFTKVRDGDMEVTIMVESDDLRSLLGKSYVAVATTDVFVDDRGWDAVIGDCLALHGGTEVRVNDHELEDILSMMDEATLSLDDDPLLPFEVKDPYYPPVRVSMPLSVFRERMTLVREGGGPRSGKEYTDCGHASMNEKCLSCFARWWRGKAAEKGVPWEQENQDSD